MRISIALIQMSVLEAVNEHGDIRARQVHPTGQLAKR